MNRYRHEYKYMISRMQEDILQLKAAGILERDPHVVSDGTYFVRSLYFDDNVDSCMFENESGIDIRSKFRIRYYNDNWESAFLEEKSKRNGLTVKESCELSQDECEQFLEGTVPEITPDLSVKKREMFLKILLRRLVPKVIVTYERVPFVYSAGNVRITFDRSITSSGDVELFLQRGYATRPIMPQGYSILEVKWDEILPLHIKDVMQLESLQWTSFSKYYMCRKYHL